MNDQDLQHVSLRGGTFDGKVTLAPPPPGALRLGARSDEDEWSELYLYLQGEVADHPHHGKLPVMCFIERRAEA